jgi:hypothetical protein
VHVSDIVNVLKCEDLREVTLVGHSSSGRFTGVAIGDGAHRAPDLFGVRLCLKAVKPCSTLSHLTDDR